jgi:hypothetical protein
MPTAMTITGRTSSITNAFVNAIVPAVPPTEGEVMEALKLLGLDPVDLRCAYCGDRASEWDHLMPLVRDKKPTGYITEIANLVPSCGKCNQSKGAAPWREWITGPAALSPATRKDPGLEARIAKLEEFERWRAKTRIDFSTAVPPELWNAHWANHDRLLAAMKEYQIHAIKVRQSVSVPGSAETAIRLP